MSNRYKIEVFRTVNGVETLVEEILYPTYFSGNAIMDEIKWMQTKYTQDEGYRVEGIVVDG